MDINKFEGLERDTYSLNLAHAENELENYIQPEVKAEWERLRLNSCTDGLTADANFFLRNCCDNHKKLEKGEPGHFKEVFRCTEVFCLCSKTCCSYYIATNK